MDEFFKQIRDTTKTRISGFDEEKILRRHVDEAFNFLISECRVNIQNAANIGSEFAYICLSIVDATYKHNIKIGDLLMESDIIHEKLKKYNIPTLNTKLRDFFVPFKLQVEKKDNVIITKVLWD
jgi:hypothetical protein